MPAVNELSYKRSQTIELYTLYSNIISHVIFFYEDEVVSSVKQDGTGHVSPVATPSNTPSHVK